MKLAHLEELVYGRGVAVEAPPPGPPCGNVGAMCEYSFHCAVSKRSIDKTGLKLVFEYGT